MGGPVFISHSSRDVKIARGICEAIETRGVACWISGRDVGPGENYGDAIVDAIERARTMVLVFSSNANNSEEIKKELALASQHRVTVIPVRVEDITPSQAFRYELATRQWIDMFVDWDQALKRLTDKIVAIQGTGEVEPPPPKPEPAKQTAPSASPRRLGPLLGAAAAVVAVVIAGVLFWSRAGTGGDPPRLPPLASQASVTPPTPVASAPATAATLASVAPAASAPVVAMPVPAVAAPAPAASMSAPAPPGTTAPTIGASSGLVPLASASPPPAPVVRLVSTEPAQPGADRSESTKQAAQPARSAPAAAAPTPSADAPPRAPVVAPATAPKLVASASIGADAIAAAGSARATPPAAADPVADLPLSPAAAPSAPTARNFAPEPARSAIDPGSPTPTVNAAPAVPGAPAPAAPAGTIALAPVVAAGAPSIEPAAAFTNVPPAPTVANPPAKAVVVAALADAIEPAKPARDSGVKSFKDCDDCPEMVVAPGGAALIGSPAQETARMPHEPAPSEAIIPAPFAVGRYDVTFDEWDACVAAGGCNNWRPGDFGWGRGRQPVIFVSWNDAHAYVAWLSQKTGKPYRLLSETEWEYAARGCTTTACPNQPFWFGTIKPEIANYDARYAYQGSPKGLARRRAVAADEGPPNPFGLSNMLGNVRQWVEDCWSADPGPPPPRGAPRLEGDCTERVTRGGSYDDKPQELRAAARSWQTAETRSQKIGFRVARALDP